VVAAASLPGLLSLASAQSKWVSLGPNGRLVYTHSPNGDRIADFSYAGYEGGGVALPDVAAKRTVTPSGADDSVAIQKAIDEVSALPLVNGFRGAVELGPGTFHCAQTLTIAASGVVLRGAGTSASGTTITVTGAPHLAISVTGNLDIASANVESEIAEAYVPSGTRAVRVADANGFHAGNTVLIRKPVTQTWVHHMGMDLLYRLGRDEHWIGSDHLDVRRSIVAIDGNVLTLDAPLLDSYDTAFFEGGHAIVRKIAVTGQLSHVGVERLRIVAPRRRIALGDPEFDALVMTDTADSWVRQVAAEETTNGIHIDKGTERVTVVECEVVQHDAVTSAGKPFQFSANGSQLLFDRCTGAGDATFYFATQARQQGPVVVLHCSFQGDGHIQPHQRWSPGLLVDSCSVPHGGIDLKNRGIMGTGHGWTTGWSVVWNSTAATLEMNEPPGIANWSIGNRGAQSNPPMPLFEARRGSRTPADDPALPAVITESPGKPVEPASLYLEQLAERLGPQALKNIGY
jgi:hypothetical protein